jgi:hypothetical protein
MQKLPLFTYAGKAQVTIGIAKDSTWLQCEESLL